MDTCNHQQEDILTLDLSNLNSVQLRAVTAPLNPILVLAGAGSGKTRTLVYRAAWLLAEKQADPRQLFAVTFTNKAAKEMRERLCKILPDFGNLIGLWIGTFHGLAHRILRTEASLIGLDPNFKILDSGEQLSCIKRCMKELNIDKETIEPSKAQNFINRKKDEGLFADNLDYKYRMSKEEMYLVQIYKNYAALCKIENAVDFADLLLLSFDLLSKNQEVALKYQTKFKHFLVDEFQDINMIQYKWFRILSKQAESIMVVGDDDQSIYGWRGAKVENIRNFSQDHANTQTIHLEQNYRSTPIILNAANALIGQNIDRIYNKNLWTEKKSGEKIEIYAGINEEDEARYIIEQIKLWQKSGGKLKDVAILYRNNALSRVLEESLVRNRINYVIYGGVKFFERAEVKDAIGYLRLIVNQTDNLALERVINMPARGIGKRTLDKIIEFANSKNICYWQAIVLLLEQKEFTGKIGFSLQEFVNLINNFSDLSISFKGKFSEYLEKLLVETGLFNFYRNQIGEQAHNKLENLQQLVFATDDFSKYYIQNNSTDHVEIKIIDFTVEFLSYTSLDGGEIYFHNLENNKDQIQLMTIHASKGLEFNLVFISGLEDGIFPSFYTRDNPKSLEEERRLFYVAITRAMQKLVLSYASKRRFHGRDERNLLVSPFLNELPADLINAVYPKPNVSPYRARFSLVSHDYSPNSSSLKKSQSSLLGKIFDSKHKIGQRVKHPKFGEGIIKDIDANQKRIKLQIVFDLHGPKWLVLAYTELEIL